MGGGRTMYIEIELLSDCDDSRMFTVVDLLL